MSGGFASMFASSFLATRLAGPWRGADLGSYFPPLIFFPIGTIAIIADLHDSGRPYKHHLVYGYGVGVSLAIFFAIVLEDRTFLPVAVGMSAQTVFMMIRIFEFSLMREQPSRDIEPQDAVIRIFARGKRAFSWIRELYWRRTPRQEDDEQRDDSAPRTPFFQDHERHISLRTNALCDHWRPDECLHVQEYDTDDIDERFGNAMFICSDQSCNDHGAEWVTGHNGFTRQ